MAYKNNFDLSAFETEIRDRFRDGFERKDYQEAVGRVSREIREALMEGKNSSAKELGFPAWFEPVRKYLGAYPEGDFERAKKKFQSAIGTMCGKDTNSMHFALPIHYRLHMPEEPNNALLRDKLDRFAFNGKTFEEAIGAPVFELDPDMYDEPPPMAAPMSHPGYITAKQARDALERDADDSIWLNPHNHYTLPLQGREIEKKRLTDFVKSDGMFKVLPVIAPSGAGKTRLISEWMRDYSVKTNPETEWEAGFLSSDLNDQARNPEPWRDWHINKNTLIVIDYTYAFDAVVKAISDRAIHRAQGRDFKVRLIVVDHVMPKSLQEDFFWGKVASSKRTADLFRTSYLEPELVLKAAGDKSEMLSTIVETAALVGVQDGMDVSRQAREAIKQLDRMGHEQGERDSVRHPLFAALLGRALRNTKGKVDFSTWNRRDLVEQYFTGKDRLPWTAASDDVHAAESKRMGLGLNAGAWVSAATLRRGLSRSSAKSHLSENFETTFQIAQRVTSTPNTFEIGPFLPDILGETFILKFLEVAADQANVFENFIGLVNAEAKDPVDLARNFRETIARLARNLAGDDLRPTDAQSTWANVVRLLNPTLYPDTAPLRIYVSFAIADVMEALGNLIAANETKEDWAELQDAYVPLMKQLEAQAEADRLFVQPETEGLATWTRTCFRFFEFSHKDSQKEIIEPFLDAARVFATNSVRSWTATMGAAFDGRLGALRVICANLNENSNAANKDGYTAAMAASDNGHLEVLRYLHQTAKCDLNATTKDGWTAALLASDNGHLEVLRYLHETAKCDLNATTKNGYTATIAASRNGHLEVLRYLHETAKCDINATAEDGWTAAMSASRNGHLEALRYLHETAKCDLNATTKNGYTATMAASRNGHLEVLSYLYETAKCDLNATKKNGWDAVLLASQNGHLEVLRYLHEIAKCDFNATTKVGLTAAIAASENGHWEVLRYLHKIAKCDLNATTADGVTAAMVAGYNGHLEVLRYLHEIAKCDLNATTADGATAAMAASDNGHLEALRYLNETAECDLNATKKDGVTAAMLAGQNGHLEVLRYLHETAECDLNATKKDGVTAAMLAGQNGHLEVLRYLHETEKCDLNATTEDGETAAMLAGQNGHLEVLRYLHEIDKCDLNATKKDGVTAAMLASKKGHLEMLRYLHEIAKCDLNTTTAEGVTAALLSGQNGHLEVLRYLHETAECDLNSTTEDGWTTAMLASQNGHLEVLRYLHEIGRCDLNATKKDGVTAAMLAGQNGHLEVLRYLHETDKCDLNTTTADGVTAALLSGQNGHLEVLRYLHETAECDLNSTTEDGWTTAMLASQNGHLEVLRYLHEIGRCDLKGANKNGLTAAMMASANDHLEVLRYLHEIG